MRMAILNILLPSPMTISPYNSNNFEYTHHNLCFNTNLHFLQNSHSFSVTQNKSTPSHKFSQMPTHLQKSGPLSVGSGCSWMQDNSMHESGATSTDWQLDLLCSALPTKPAEVSSVQDLYEFICSDQISQHSSQFKDGEDIPPLVIGISAPQGCGKTTLVFALDYLFRLTGRKSATLSIDDFYLTTEGQAKLRETNPGNALLELRGNAGSHDLQFSIETLTALTKLTKEGLKMKLPWYDKSAYNGRGDRADPSTWPEVKGPLTVLLFEGWMLGFKPLPVEVVKAIDPQLETVNKNLEAYYDAWDKFINSWIVIKIKDPSCVYEWRLQAEIAMKKGGQPGMSDEEVKDFVSRYLPAYNAYLPTLYSEGPNGSDPEHLLLIEIDEGRNPF